MHARALVSLVSVWCLFTIAPGAAPATRRSLPAAAYIQALRTADLFLTAWAQRDDEAGLALISDAVLAKGTVRQGDFEVELRQYMTGLSNPHHEAFEIRPGIRVGSDRYAFPVRLLELTAGEPSGFAFSDTLEVVRQADEWRVDRLPRAHHPD
jgi:hypothetical protein